MVVQAQVQCGWFSGAVQGPLVLRGFSQRPGVDFDESFSLVVKPATVRTVLSLALSQHWPVHQLDVKNDFLHGTLTEIVYCAQPSGFEDSAHLDFVCRLNKSLYGLKQASRAWYNQFFKAVRRGEANWVRLDA